MRLSGRRVVSTEEDARMFRKRSEGALKRTAALHLQSFVDERGLSALHTYILPLGSPVSCIRSKRPG